MSVLRVRAKSSLALLELHFCVQRCCSEFVCIRWRLKVKSRSICFVLIISINIRTRSLQKLGQLVQLFSFFLIKSRCLKYSFEIVLHLFIELVFGQISEPFIWLKLLNNGGSGVTASWHRSNFIKILGLNSLINPRWLIFDLFLGAISISGIDCVHTSLCHSERDCVNRLLFALPHFFNGCINHIINYNILSIKICK